MHRNTKTNARKADTLSRRRFMGGAGAALALTAVPRHVLGGAGFTGPSDRLTIALIGAGGRGRNVTRGLLRYPDAEVTAICDPNEESDYSAFYYRGTAGRKPVRKMITEHYSRRYSTGAYKGCTEYDDYRILLEKEKTLDAVVIATPDHVHAVVAMAAIKLGKHVYCEKPLAHSIHEVRAITEAAQKAKVATQMGNQGHSGEGIRRICEWIWAGVIGSVREVHAWSDTGYWAPLDGRPKETPPVPAGMNWDLWIGPAKYRPYHPAYTPYNWRGWWDFGTGAIGDMACHNMDPAFWALKLKYPTTVEASSTRVNSETTTAGSTVRYTFPARGDLPPCKLTWYDGGLRPPLPEGLKPGANLGGNGIILIGDKGTILAGGWGGMNEGPRLLPESRMQGFEEPPKTIARSQGHDRDWLNACKGGKAASSNFTVAGPMTEAILLGNVAVRTGKKLEWDGAALKAINAPEADAYIRPPYRSGWSL